MKFLLVGIVVVCVLSVSVVLVMWSGSDSNQSMYPADGVPVLPVTTDRPVQPVAVDGDGSVDGNDSPRVSNPVAAKRVPGGVAPMGPLQHEFLFEAVLNSQPYPRAPNEPMRFLVADEAAYTIVLDGSIDDDMLVVNVLLKEAPFTESRAQAESVFAQQFGGERDDLCGIPFYVHVAEDHPLFERGNLGLEHCGANKLEDGE